jgi:pyridoxine 5-phosphate synthase
MTKLSVNVDHVATLRQARGASYPNPVEGARRAEDAGAHGITVHLRADRRHIQDSDVRALADCTRGKLNLEIASGDEMIDIALDIMPAQVTLVPERPEEVTTEGGLDLSRQGEQVERAAASLAAAGIEVSLFLDPDLEQLERLASLGSETIRGYEINTDAYTKAFAAPDHELQKIVRAAQFGPTRGFAVYAGHGLTTDNVGPVAALPEVEELNIGHSIVSRAGFIGMGPAVTEMLAAMARG